jgi:hypothetical protein
MPALSNNRREIFCQKVANGMTQAKAYEIAGYVPNRKNASRLMKTNEDVIERIEELKALELGKFATEKDLLRNMFLTNYSLAIKAGNITAATAAADKLARLDGHMVDRKEIGGPGDFANLSDAELIELIAEPLNGAEGDYDAGAPAGGFESLSSDDDAPESE